MSHFVKLTESGKAIYIAAAHVEAVDRVKTTDVGTRTRIRTLTGCFWVSESPEQVVFALDAVLTPERAAAPEGFDYLNIQKGLG